MPPPISGAGKPNNKINGNTIGHIELYGCR
jgi:hypothetical protein